MKVFLCWSGVRSRGLAESLRDWIPCVIQSAEPWMSEEDVRKGGRWAFEIGERLQDANACLVCLTPENLESPWIHFEAGAIAKIVDQSLVCPILLGLRAADLTGPLSQFQGAEFKKAEMRKVTKRLLVIGVAMLALGCSMGPPDTLELGTYDYTATVDVLDVTFDGQLTITAMTPLGLEGSWDVAGFHPELVSAPNGDGYTVSASGSLVSFSMRQEIGPAVECSGVAFLLPGENRLGGTCEIWPR